MKRRFLITSAALGAVLCCCFLYSALIVPTVLFPPLSLATVTQSLVKEEGTTERIKDFSRRYIDLIAPLFPDENDWRRRQPRVIVPNDGGGIFLFKGEPKISADRRELTLTSCTVVFPSSNMELSEEERFRRAIVVETSDKATIQLRNPFSLNGVPSLSDFEKGLLTGEVQIRSGMEEPGAEDDFFLSTRDISFTTDQVLANNEVFFRFGPHRGEGEGLRIEFAPHSSVSDTEENPYRKLAKEGNVGGGFSIEWISLLKLYRLQFELDGGTLEKTASSETNTEANTEENEKVNVEIRCENGVLFAPNPDEPAGWVGRFMEDVEAVIYHKAEKEDRFTCRNLYLYLTDPEIEETLAKIAQSYTGPKPKRMPSGQIARLVPRRVKGVRAEETPANIEWSAEGISVFGDEVVYDIPARRFLLSSESDAEPVRLIRYETEVQAGAIDYTAGDEGMFGKLAASRGGTLTTLLTEGEKTSPFSMSWKNGLRINPDENDPNLIRMALNGDVQISLAPFGRITSKEADFWCVLPSDGIRSSDGPDLSQMRPRSAQFRGEIQMTSDQGICRLSDEMTIRFQETGPLGSDAAAAETASASETASENNRSMELGSLFGEKGTSSLQIDGGRLDLWVRYDASRQSEISRMMIRQKMRVVETAADGTETLRIEGDDAQIDKPSSEQAAVELVGRPATFHGQGLDLSGYNIRVDRAKNQFSVVGRGKLTFIPNGSLAAISGSAAKEPSETDSVQSLPVDVHWSRGMTFDGQTLLFQGDEKEPVFVQQKPATELRSMEIRFKLRLPIQIFELGTAPKEKLEVALSECIGSTASPVDIVSYGAIPGQQGGGYFRGQVLNLRFENLTGAIHADGPGWIRGTGPTPKSADHSEKTNETNPLSAASHPWTHLHLTFSRALEGNVSNGVVTALGDVTSVAAGSNQPEMVLDAGNRDTFPPDAFFLSCHSLSLSRSPDAVDSKGFDMTAEGNALFRYDAYIGRGDKIKYSDTKKNVILEGDGLNSASIHRQEAPGTPVQTNRFSRGTFNLETKKIEADISSTTLDALPN